MRSYENRSIGISFQYPDGYYVVVDKPYDRLRIQNLEHRLTGVPSADFRAIEIQYGSYLNSEGESAAKARPGVTREDIAIDGGSVRFYTYPNPNNAAWTIGEAFWEGFSATMTWSRGDGSTEAEGIQQAEELVLMRQVLPTISLKH